MTEQEKRERVKVMEDTIYEFHKKNLCDHFSHTACALHCDECHLGVLVDAGYRKEEEVRKEKAKEIYKAVLDLRELMVNNDDALCILRNVESWAKEDGVEVEE